MARTVIPITKASTVRVLDLFAGIGGFTLGLERAGFETVAFCEIDPYAQKVLKKNWPGIPIYDDVRTITAERLASDGIRVDVITGGFPCQDISVSGNRAGIQDGTRSGLWSECARLLGELRPRYAIFENVTNLLHGERGDWFKRVLWDISALGYDAEWHCIPASELGAHHHRDRVWIIAHSQSARPKASKRQSGIPQEKRRPGLAIPCRHSTMADSKRSRQPGQGQPIFASDISAYCQREAGDAVNVRIGQEWEVEPELGRVADGIPDRSHRLKALGNAVVPQIPELIGRAILANESHH